MNVRRLGPPDTEFLRTAFVWTVCWRDEVPAVSVDELLALPSLAIYIAGWGRAGDDGVVAIGGPGEPLGAAWYREFDDAQHGYGYVSPAVPELGIAVRPEARGRGLGRHLMVALTELADASGYPGLSLSVEDDNVRARRLYESLGFRPVGHVGTAATMLLQLRND